MKPPYAPNVQNQTVSYGGITWKGNPGQDWYPESGSGGGGAGGGIDVVANAQKLLDFQKTANAPVVTALQGQVDPLKDKYTQLVASIKGNQQLDTNRQTLTTNNELGRRGLTTESGLGAQELTNALTPIDTQYAGLTANANAGSITDQQNLALQIANLQAGNADSAISGGLQYGNIQQQAQQAAQTNAYNQQLLQLSQQTQASTNNQNAIANALAQAKFDAEQKKAASTTTSNPSSYLTPSSFTPVQTQFGAAGGGIYDSKGNLTAYGRSYYGV